MSVAPPSRYGGCSQAFSKGGTGEQTKTNCGVKKSRILHGQDAVYVYLRHFSINDYKTLDVFVLRIFVQNKMGFVDFGLAIV